jgi:hypothetical protein
MRVANLLFFALSFGMTAEVFSLPKNKIAEPAPATQQPTKTQPTPFTPIVADEEEMMRSGCPLNASPAYRYLGPTQIEQTASPYVDVRIGIPETPGGNNHMRRQAALSPNGVVHMVYGVYEVDSTALDSALNFLYFYNAYDCNNSNALRNGSLEAPWPIPFLQPTRVPVTLTRVDFSSLPAQPRRSCTDAATPSPASRPPAKPRFGTAPNVWQCSRWIPRWVVGPPRLPIP